jgi:protein TonB
MAQATFLEQKRIRPGAALTVILMHGAALTALLLAKTDFAERVGFTPIHTYPVPLPPPPPPPSAPQPERAQESWTRPIPSVPTVPTLPVPDDPPGPVPDPGSLAGGTDTTGTPYVPPPQPPAVPQPEPVRIAARMVSNDLQPPYPVSEERAQREGRVVIRVTIGTDGRVIAAQRVSATSDAFWTATVRHARSRWRFRPATVDGRPVEATQTLTVHFQLSGQA